MPLPDDVIITPVTIHEEFLSEHGQFLFQCSLEEILKRFYIYVKEAEAKCNMLEAKLQKYKGETSCKGDR